MTWQAGQGLEGLGGRKIHYFPQYVFVCPFLSLASSGIPQRGVDEVTSQGGGGRRCRLSRWSMASSTRVRRMVEGAGCTAQGATLTPRVSNPRTARPGCQGHAPLSSHSPPAPKHWIGLSLRVMAVSWCSQFVVYCHQFVVYCHGSHLVLSISLSLTVMAVTWCSPSVCHLLSWQSLGALHQFVAYCHGSHLVLSISLSLTVTAVSWHSPSVCHCHGSVSWCFPSVFHLLSQLTHWTALTPTVSATNRRFPEITGKDNLTLLDSEVPWMEAAAEKSWSVTVLDLQTWTYYNLY